MNRLIQMIVVVAVIASTTGCVSAKGYFVDRGRDAADIFSVAVGIGAGVKARIGPLHAGLTLIHDAIGLRGGEFFKEPFLRQHSPNPLDADLSIFAYEICNIGADRYKTVRVKVKGMPFIIAKCDSYSTSVYCEEKPFINPYFTQIEVAGGLIGTVRLGFNPGELLDFILGWTTIDIFNDDLEIREILGLKGKGYNRKAIKDDEQDAWKESYYEKERQRLKEKSSQVPENIVTNAPNSQR